MSDQTGDALARAEAGLAAEQTKTERRERELLDRISAGLPGAIDGIARRAAEARTALASTESSVRAAKQSDTDAAVQSIWDDSQNLPVFRIRCRGEPVTRTISKVVGHQPGDGQSCEDVLGTHPAGRWSMTRVRLEYD